jgi:hypothetical protein
VTRRSALARAAHALAHPLALAVALAGCAQDPAAQPQAQADLKIATVAIDTSALSSLDTSPVAAWVRSSLSGRIAHALEGRMAPGDPGGATLAVRVDAVVLGAVGAGGGALDRISGEATLRGGGAEGAPVSVAATLPYAASRGDSIQAQPALERRADALAQAFADQIPGKLGL